jgi:GNAT superfamily N-acetyltransferase
LSGGARRLVIRPAIEADLETIERMIDDFVVGHPAHGHPRPRSALREAYFGTDPVAKLLIAVRNERIVGMVEWMRIYDMFWAKFGARVEWLYVQHGARGFGVAAAIIAEVCAQSRRAGCAFLTGGADDPDIVALYERVAFSGSSRTCFLSASAFQAFAALAGLPPRDIVRGLPDKALNYVEAAQ